MHSPPNPAQSWPGHPRDPPKTRSKTLNKCLPCPLTATRCSHGWAYATGVYIQQLPQCTATGVHTQQLPQHTHRASEPHNPTNTAHGTNENEFFGGFGNAINNGAKRDPGILVLMCRRRQQVKVRGFCVRPGAKIKIPKFKNPLCVFGSRGCYFF